MMTNKKIITLAFVLICIAILIGTELAFIICNLINNNGISFIC